MPLGRPKKGKRDTLASVYADVNLLGGNISIIKKKQMYQMLVRKLV
jgi:hypothetical protein